MINPKQQCLVLFQYFYIQCLYTFKNNDIVVCFVGAFQEQFHLCWVAATGEFGIEAGTLFLIQFFGIFGLLDGFCMKIMKSRFLYVAYR
jgi:protoheme IX farnesyltransferase